MRRIQAAVVPEVGELAVETLELDDPEPGEVLIDLRATGVCHTDYHFYQGDYDVPKPVVLGHEGAGVVAETGDGVTAVESGDRVVLSLLPACNTCRFCRSSRPYLCETALEVRFQGTLLDGTRRLHRPDGPVNHFYAQSSFATAAVVPTESVVPVPEELPFEVASMLGCGAMTGLGAVWNTATLDPGDDVAIFGFGGTGASAVLAADAISLGEVVVVDMVDGKLELAAELGATHTVDASAVDPVAAIKERVPGGVQYAFDFVGFDDTVREQALEVTEPGGTLVLSGGAREEAQLSVTTLLEAGRTVTSNVAGSARPHLDIPRYADLFLAGDLPLDRLLTRTYPLESLGTAFDDLSAGRGVKTALSFECPPTSGNVLAGPRTRGAMFDAPSANSWWALPYAEIARVARQDGSVMVLPVGSVEQHGHHLPVATDTILVEAVASSAVERVADELPVVVAPPIWAGYSPHHLSFGGTLSLEFETLLYVIEQVAATGLENGFDALLLLNGHGGNIPLIGGATSTIGVDHHGVEILGTTYFSLAEPFVDEVRESEVGGMAHGGEFETSLMLHYRPALVDEDRLQGELLDEPYDDGTQDMFAAGPLAVYREFSAYSESGAIGDPGLATPEKGRRLADGLEEALASLLRSVVERNRNGPG